MLLEALNRRDFLRNTVGTLVAHGFTPALAKSVMRSAASKTLYLIVNPGLQPTYSDVRKIVVAGNKVLPFAAGVAKPLGSEANFRDSIDTHTGWYPIAVPVRADKVGELLASVRGPFYDWDIGFKAGGDMVPELREKLVDRAASLRQSIGEMESGVESYGSWLETCRRQLRVTLSVLGQRDLVEINLGGMRLTNAGYVADLYGEAVGTGDILTDWWNGFGVRAQPDYLEYDVIKHLLNAGAVAPEGGWGVSRGQINKMTGDQYDRYNLELEKMHQKRFDDERRVDARPEELEVIEPSADDLVSSPMHQAFEARLVRALI